MDDPISLDPLWAVCFVANTPDEAALQARKQIDPYLGKVVLVDRKAAFNDEHRAAYEHNALVDAGIRPAPKRPLPTLATGPDKIHLTPDTGYWKIVNIPIADPVPLHATPDHVPPTHPTHPQQRNTIAIDDALEALEARIRRLSGRSFPETRRAWWESFVNDARKDGFRVRLEEVDRG